MSTFPTQKKKSVSTFTELNSETEIWYSLAGRLVQIPPVNSVVYYFPMGHVEHASEPVDLRWCRRPLPPRIACKVLAVEYLADRATDDVCIRFRLGPLPRSEPINPADDALEQNPAPNPAIQVLSLTQRFANDDSATHTNIRRDVHGTPWGFSSIPTRSGVGIGCLNRFLHAKGASLEDAIVFMNDSKGQPRVGIFRANTGRGGILQPKDVIRALKLAVIGKPFTVLYYPRFGAADAEFVVKAARVEAAMQVPWEAGMRVSVPFEIRGTSDIGMYTGTIASVQHWAWKPLQVTLDMPMPVRVNPWRVSIAAPAQPQPQPQP